MPRKMALLLYNCGCSIVDRSFVAGIQWVISFRTLAPRERSWNEEVVNPFVSGKSKADYP